MELAVAQAVRTNGLDLADDFAENVADGGPEQGQDDDNYDGDQDQDQGVFHQALALVIGKSKHFDFSFVKLAFGKNITGEIAWVIAIKRKL